MSRQGRGRGRLPKQPPKKEVTVNFLLTFYDYFLREHQITKIAEALGTSAPVLYKWIEKFPELKEAKELAVKRRQETCTFQGHVYRQLPPKIRKIWKEIQFWEDAGDADEKIAEIMSGKSKKIRKEIWIHAMIHYGFSKSEACRIASIPRATVDNWSREDPVFRQMILEIHNSKKDFVEKSLLDLVEMKNPGAIMFASRTLNRDRGYNDKLEVEHTGTIAHVGYSIDDLDLPLEARKQYLDAVRRKEAVDVETVETKQLAEITEV